MSTNKTPNYNLHAWTPDDDFLRAEINENFAAIDAQAPRVIYGTYVATGKDLTVEVGEYIKALLICYSGGAMGNGNGSAFATVAVQGRPTSGVTLTDTGFTVAYSNSTLPGFSGWVYHYIALV